MYDGRERNEDRSAAPSNFLECIRTRDVVAIALEVLRELDNLVPAEIPVVPPRSLELEKAMAMWPPRSVGEDVEEKNKQPFIEEHRRYCQAVLDRAGAKAENLRRLRTTLWAEQCLRSHKRPEHEVLRAFNRDEWFVPESAAIDVAEREAQVKARM